MKRSITTIFSFLLLSALLSSCGNSDDSDFEPIEPQKRLTEIQGNGRYIVTIEYDEVANTVSAANFFDNSLDEQVDYTFTYIQSSGVEFVEIIDSNIQYSYNENSEGEVIQISKGSQITTNYYFLNNQYIAYESQSTRNNLENDGERINKLVAENNFTAEWTYENTVSPFRNLPIDYYNVGPFLGENDFYWNRDNNYLVSTEHAYNGDIIFTNRSFKYEFDEDGYPILLTITGYKEDGSVRDTVINEYIWEELP